MRTRDKRKSRHLAFIPPNRISFRKFILLPLNASGSVLWSDHNFKFNVEQIDQLWLFWSQSNCGKNSNVFAKHSHQIFMRNCVYVVCRFLARSIQNQWNTQICVKIRVSFGFHHFVKNYSVEHTLGFTLHICNCNWHEYFYYRAHGTSEFSTIDTWVAGFFLCWIFFALYCRHLIYLQKSKQRKR